MNVRTYWDILIWWRMLYCHIVVLLYCDIVMLSYWSVVLMTFLLLFVMLLSVFFCLFCQTSADAHEYIIKLKDCLLAELEPADGTSDITASGEAYDENLHSLMQTFWKMFGLGQITQNVTCTICSSVTTRVEPFSKLLCNFQNHIMRWPWQTGSAHSIVSSNITISCKRTFPTMDISNTTHSNKLASHHLMHCTRTQEEWQHQNHFGSRLSCMGLESVYYFWITWRNGGFKIQPHCHCKPQGK